MDSLQIPAAARGRHPSLLVAFFLLVSWSLVADASTNDEASGDEASSPIPLNSKRLFALGMIESGNDDRGVGPAGEVSRYQIHPAVWKSYSTSKAYHDPGVSLAVAREHWTYLTNYFRQRTGRDPSDFDLYVLWNTRFGYYASRGFEPRGLPANVRSRAQRFVNLVNR
jgi:hypothetical protein